MAKLNTTQRFQIGLIRLLKKLNVDEESIFFFLTLTVGVISGAVAVFMAKSVEFLGHQFHTFTTPSDSSIVAGLFFIFISGFLTTRFFKETNGSGIPQTKIAVVVNHGRIKSRDWLAKLIVSILSLGSGVPLGSEGPTVTVTAGIGSSFGRFFSLPKTKVKSLLAVGAAGGIAAAFNTPIAAVTFTLEEVLGNFNARSIGPIIISSVASAVTASILRGDHSVFSVLKHKFEDPLELPFYFVVGILAALLGPLWVKTVLKMREVKIKIFKEHNLTPILIVFTFFIGAALLFPRLLGTGHHLIDDVLLSKFVNTKFILILLIGKFLFTALFYSTGISGGLFFPTLFIGSMIGSLVGISGHFLYSELSDVGAFALVGMGAFFAAVIRAPITSILIIFEMTQDYKIILPLMIANITAYLISNHFMDGSIYEQISEQNGVHLPGKEDSEVLETLTVEEAMIEAPFTVNANITIKESIKLAQKNQYSGYPVLKSGLLHGVISIQQIANAMAHYQAECLVGDICTQNVISIYPDQSLMVAFHYLNKYKISRLMVVSRINDRRLLGILTAEDIVNRFGYHIQEEGEKTPVNLDDLLQSDEENKNEMEPSATNS